MKKFMSVLLSVCMVMMYTIPAFAYTSDAASKVAMSDQEMAGAVGGYGDVDAKVNTYTSYASGGYVNATFTNALWSSASANYTLILKDSNGNPIATLASGSLAQGRSVEASGKAPSGAWVAEACITNSQYAPVKACDTRTVPYP